MYSVSPLKALPLKSLVNLKQTSVVILCGLSSSLSLLLLATNEQAMVTALGFSPVFDKGKKGSWVEPHHRWAGVPADGSGRGSRCATDLLHSQPPGESYTRDCHEGPEAAAARRRSKVSRNWNGFPHKPVVVLKGDQRPERMPTISGVGGQRAERASVITGRSEMVSKSLGSGL